MRLLIILGLLHSSECRDGSASCNSATCENGNCEFGLCLCHRGWAGPGCAEKVCDCENGTCDLVSKTCICQEHWGGERCDVAICDDCSAQGGNCLPGGVCECKKGWKGSSCAKAVCNPPCENGGRCTSPDNCSCKENWSGKICDKYGPSAKICSFTAHRIMLFDETFHFIEKYQGKKCSVTLLKTPILQIELLSEINTVIARSNGEAIELTNDHSLSTDFGENRQEFNFEDVTVILTENEVWIKYFASSHPEGLCAASVSQTSDLLLPNGQLPSECFREALASNSIQHAQLADTCAHLKQLGNFEKCAALVPSARLLMSGCVSELAQRCSNSSNTDCLCDTVSGWSSTCAQFGFEVQEWRRADLCPELRCPKNRIWSEAVELSSPNCENVRNNAALPSKSNKFPGCSCPTSQILREDGICVQKEFCGCSFNNVFYEEGAVFTSDKICVCKGLSWECETKKAARRCRLFGAGHVDDFDGGRNSIVAHGDFIALRMETFTVNVEFSQCAGDQFSICLHKIEVNDIKNHLRLGPSDAVFINGEQAIGSHNGGDIRYYGSSEITVIELTEHKIVLTFVPGVSVIVEYDGDGNHEGICAPQSSMEQHVKYSVDFEHFASSYNINHHSNSLPVALSKIGNCAHEKFAKCQVFLFKELKKCNHVIPPELFISRCQADICNCFSDTGCQKIINEAVNEYVRQCRNALVHSKEKIQLPEDCKQKCGENEIWSETVCPLQSSCQSLSSTANHFCAARLPACSCKEGFFRNEIGKCIPRAQCACYDGDGLSMYPGETSTSANGESCFCAGGLKSCKSPFTNDQELVRGKRTYLRSNCAYGLELQSKESANVCQIDEFSRASKICGCIAGFWDANLQKCVRSRKDCTCSEASKPVDGVCHSVVCLNGRWIRRAKACSGECSVYGTRHLKTFDGNSLAFSSTCEVILVTNKCKSKPDEAFTVTLENKRCKGTNLICTKHLRVYHANGKVFSVHGNYENSGRRRIIRSGVEPRLGVRQVGLYLIIQVSQDVALLWDVSLRVHVILENNLNGEVCGMCGNFNRDASDDLTARNGAVVTSGELLAQGWRYSSRKSMCAAPSGETEDSSTCLAKDQSKNAYAIETCQVLYSDLFRNCREKIDPTSYYEDCKESACSCSRGGECECLCATIASFARACAVAGEPVRWRSPDLCPLMCEAQEKQPGGCVWHYDTCRPYCEERCERSYCSLSRNLFCIDGCFPTCPDGYLFSDKDNDCVLRHICEERKAEATITKDDDKAPQEPIFLEPISEPIRVLANDISKEIPKSCKIADREIVVFVESSDDDELLEKYTEATIALKFLLLGDKNGITAKNNQLSVLKALTASQNATITPKENERIVLWSDQLSLNLVDEIKLMFSASTKSKLLITMTSTVSTNYWHYILLEQKIEIFSLSTASETSLESRRVLISSPNEIAEGTHQIVQELCAAPKVPSKIDVEEIIPSEVLDMTPEPIKIEKCATDKSISIFYDSITQENLSDFVQKVQQYLTGEINGPFDLSDSRISETEYSRRVFLLFEANADQLSFKENDVVITSNQIEHIDTGTFYVSCFKDLVSSTKILREIVGELCKIREIPLIPEKFNPAPLPLPDLKEPFRPKPAQLDEDLCTGSNTCACDQEMKLILLVDGTLQMQKRSNRGKYILQFLKKLSERIDFNKTSVEVKFYGENRLRLDKNTFIAKSKEIFDEGLSAVDFSAMRSFKRRQPMINLRKFLTNLKLDKNKRSSIILFSGSQDESDNVHSKYVVKLLKQHLIAFSSLLVAPNGDDFSSLKKFDYSGLHFFLSRSVRAATQSHVIDEVITAVCSAPLEFSAPAKLKLVEKRSCNLEMEADIIFVLDGSFSTRQDGFDKILSFVSATVDALSGNIQYAAIQYSDVITEEFYFKYRMKKDLLEEITAMKYDSGWSTYTGLAMEKAWSMLFDQQFGARNAVTKIMVILTDGRTKDDIVKISESIKSAGDTTVLAVGLNSAPVEELLTLATSKDLAFYTHELADIFHLFAQLVDKICITKENKQKVAITTTTTTTTTTTMTSSTVSLTSVTSLVNVTNINGISKTASTSTTTSTTTSTLTTTTSTQAITIERMPNTILLLPQDISTKDILDLVKDLPEAPITILVGDKIILENAAKHDAESAAVFEDIELLPPIDLVEFVDAIEPDQIVIPVITDTNKNSMKIIIESSPTIGELAIELKTPTRVFTETKTVIVPDKSNASEIVELLKTLPFEEKTTVKLVQNNKVLTIDTPIEDITEENLETTAAQEVQRQDLVGDVLAFVDADNSEMVRDLPKEPQIVIVDENVLPDNFENVIRSFSTMSDIDSEALKLPVVAPKSDEEEVVFILPKESKPEEVNKFIEDHEDNKNLTVIVGSTIILEQADETKRNDNSRASQISERLENAYVVDEDRLEEIFQTKENIKPVRIKPAIPISDRIESDFAEKLINKVAENLFTEETTTLPPTSEPTTISSQKPSTVYLIPSDLNETAINLVIANLPENEPATIFLDSAILVEDIVPEEILPITQELIDSVKESKDSTDIVLDSVLQHVDVGQSPIVPIVSEQSKYLPTKLKNAGVATKPVQVEPVTEPEFIAKPEEFQRSLEELKDDKILIRKRRSVDMFFPWDTPASEIVPVVNELRDLEEEQPFNIFVGDKKIITVDESFPADLSIQQIEPLLFDLNPLDIDALENMINNDALSIVIKPENDASKATELERLNNIFPAVEVAPINGVKMPKVDVVSVLPTGSQSKDIIDAVDVFNPKDNVTVFVGKSMIPEEAIPIVTVKDEPDLSEQLVVNDLVQAIVDLNPADVVLVVTEQNQDILLSLDEANIPVLPVIVDKIEILTPVFVTSSQELPKALLAEPVKSLPSCVKANDAEVDPLSNLEPSTFIILPDIIANFNAPSKILEEASRKTDAKVLFRNRIFNVEPMFEIDTITKIRQFVAVDSSNRLKSNGRGVEKINEMMKHSSIILVTNESSSQLEQLVKRSFICFRTLDISFFAPTTTTTITTTLLKTSTTTSTKTYSATHDKPVVALIPSSIANDEDTLRKIMTKIKDATDSPVNKIIMDENENTQEAIAQDVIQALLREKLEKATLVPIVSQNTQLVPEYIKIGFGVGSNPILIGEEVKRPIVPEKLRIGPSPDEELFENLTKIRPVIIIAPSDIEPTFVENVIDELDTKGNLDVIIGDQHVLAKVPIQLAKEKDIVVLKAGPLNAEILDPIITFADKSAIVLPILNFSATEEFTDQPFVRYAIEKSPMIDTKIDVESGNLPDLMESVNRDIQNTPLTEIQLVASRSEDENLVEDILDILQTKAEYVKLVQSGDLRGSVSSSSSSSSSPEDNYTEPSLIIPIVSEKSKYIITEAKDVSIRFQYPVIPIFVDDYIEPIINPIHVKDIDELELDDVKRVIECSAIIEPGREYVDNLKEKIIVLLPTDIPGDKIFSLVEEIHELHPEQKIFLAHLGEIYPLKNGPNFIAEVKNTVKLLTRREQFFQHRSNLEALEMLEREFSNSVIINIVGKNTDKELDDALRNLSFCFYNKNVQFLDAAFMQTSTTSIPSEPATTAAVTESTTRQTASPALETPSESCQASCPEIFSFWNLETSCPAHCVSRNRRESSTCELVERIQNVEMQDGCIAENLRLKVCAGPCNDMDVEFDHEYGKLFISDGLHFCEPTGLYDRLITVECEDGMKKERIIKEPANCNCRFQQIVDLI